MDQAQVHLEQQVELHTEQVQEQLEDTQDNMELELDLLQVDWEEELLALPQVV